MATASSTGRRTRRRRQDSQATRGRCHAVGCHAVGRQCSFGLRKPLLLAAPGVAGLQARRRVAGGRSRGTCKRLPQLAAPAAQKLRAASSQSTRRANSETKPPGCLRALGALLTVTAAATGEELWGVAAASAELRSDSGFCLAARPCQENSILEPGSLRYHVQSSTNLAPAA